MPADQCPPLRSGYRRSVTPCDRIDAYFSEVEFDRSVRAMRSYFAPDLHFTGSAFDGLFDAASPNEFTALDMLAVSTLSVEVPPRAALRLIASSDVRPLLVEIPASATIWSHPELLDDVGFANQLWRLVRAHDGVGRTISSKLLAAKRPHLIPIYDQHVGAALGFGDHQWPFMQAVARDAQVEPLLHTIEQARTAAGILAGISVLRLIDIVIWMRRHGWTSHETHSCDCDFRGFELPVGETR